MSYLAPRTPHLALNYSTPLRFVPYYEPTITVKGGGSRAMNFWSL
ncbi:MAG: hypothetical protein N3B10_13555 [Armatimonadetes bacterium]|nr:hypothetical protein [Armatimonadota bacterium]MCX7969495.1 hypothetical protein [Armatimonadota bacterium]MDW8142099.1 hypothetical protein [Armatimonadota bacterium]